MTQRGENVLAAAIIVALFGVMYLGYLVGFWITGVKG